MSIVATLLLLTAALETPPVGNHSAELRHIGEIYLANRSSFGFATLHFDYVTARADNAADARAGRHEHRSTGRGFYSFDGWNGRYERLYDEADLLGRAEKVGDQIRSSIRSVRMLTDGGSTLIDMIGPAYDLKSVEHTAQIYPSSGYFYRDQFIPLDLGDPASGSHDLVHVLKLIESGELQLVDFETEVQLEGRSVVHLACKSGLGRRDYWIDMQRGAVPVQAIDLMNKRGNTIQVNNDDLRESHGSWLPYKRTTYMDDNRALIQVSIRQADLNVPPGREVFRLEFPEPMPIIDSSRNLSYPARKTWSLLNLPSANSPKTRRLSITEFQPPSPAMPGERRGWPIASILMCSLGVGLAIFASFRIYRARMT